MKHSYGLLALGVHRYGLNLQLMHEVYVEIPQSRACAFSAEIALARHTPT